MRRLLPSLLLLALPLAGCLGDGDAGPLGPDPQAPGTALAFGAGVVALPECRYANCYEPTIAADPQGRLFVADGTTSAVAVSGDGGRTWEQRAPPPLPAAAAQTDGSQSDVLLQVAPDGRLYWSALVIVRPAGQFVLEGIQVAWSDDGAATWAGDVHVSPATATPQVVYPDRQWLGFSPDGALYLTYNQIPTGIWSARSDDGGATWTSWTRAVPLEDRVGVGQSGPPVADAQGRVFVPACRLVEAPGEAGGGQTMVYRSEDRGATFVGVPADAPCSWFPVLAVAPDGRLVLATQPGGLSVLVSDDGGLSFGAATAWGDGPTVAGPWPMPRADGGLDVAWFRDGSSSADLMLTSGTLDGGPESTVQVGTATGEGSSRTWARTDFASAARLPDGRIAAVWVEGNTAVVAVQA